MATVAKVARSREGWKLPTAITLRAGIGAREVEEDSRSSTTGEVNEKRAFQHEVDTSASTTSSKSEEYTSVSLLARNTTLRAVGHSPHEREMTGEQANVHGERRLLPMLKTPVSKYAKLSRIFVRKSEVPVPPMTPSFMHDP